MGYNYIYPAGHGKFTTNWYCDYRTDRWDGDMHLNPLCITWQEYSVITAFCVHTFEISVVCHTHLCEVVWNGSGGTDGCGWRGSYQKTAKEGVNICSERLFKSLTMSDKLWRLMVWLNLQKWIKCQKSADFVQSHQYTVASRMGPITWPTDKTWWLLFKQRHLPTQLTSPWLATPLHQPHNRDSPHVSMCMTELGSKWTYSYL